MAFSAPSLTLGPAPVFGVHVQRTEEGSGLWDEMLGHSRIFTRRYPERRFGGRRAAQHYLIQHPLRPSRHALPSELRGFLCEGVLCRYTIHATRSGSL